MRQDGYACHTAGNSAEITDCDVIQEGGVETEFLGRPPLRYIKIKNSSDSK